MPNIIGLAQFPQKSDPTQVDIYAACILVFLKPWRLPVNIKSPEQTWTDALNEFLKTASEQTLDIINNLEHKHDAQAAAENQLQVSLDLEDMCVNKDMMELDESEPEEMLEQAQLEIENHREVVPGVQAVHIGEQSGVFGSQQTPVRACDERATDSEAQMLKCWLQMMKQGLDNTNALHNPAGTRSAYPNDIGTVEPI
ncbi:hypothetical protein FRC12_014016 [Ceratobasidium sp. 428]|nr:hypothetical protein FRC12_014016 [Ceratobasidium sp. 428]